MSDSSFSFISPSPFVAARSRALQLFRGDEDRVVELFGQAHKLVLSGEGSKIGANAVVTKDVQPGSTMIGIPAKPVPVLALTADAMSGEGERLVSLGFDQAHPKPIQPAELLRAVAELSAGRALLAVL